MFFPELKKKHLDEKRGHSALEPFERLRKTKSSKCLDVGQELSKSVFVSPKLMGQFQAFRLGKFSFGGWFVVCCSFGGSVCCLLFFLGVGCFSCYFLGGLLLLGIGFLVVVFLGGRHVFVSICFYSFLGLLVGFLSRFYATVGVGFGCRDGCCVGASLALGFLKISCF